MVAEASANGYLVPFLRCNEMIFSQISTIDMETIRNLHPWIYRQILNLETLLYLPIDLARILALAIRRREELQLLLLALRDQCL